MTDSTCSEPDCDGRASSRGLCKQHYGRAYRAGAITVRERRPPLADIDVQAMTVTCPACGPGVRLRVRRRSSGTVSYSCRACERGTGRRRYPTERMSAEDRRLAYIRWKYKISTEEYSLMAQAQAGRCLICQQFDDKLVVDHCHESGTVRGLLCHRCNVALGWMDDDPIRLSRAARYLKRKVA